MSYIKCHDNCSSKKNNCKRFLTVDLDFINAFRYIPEIDPNAIFKLTKIKITLTDSESTFSSDFIMDGYKVKEILTEHVSETHDNAIAVNKKVCKIPHKLTKGLRVVKVNFEPTVEGFAKHAFNLLKPLAKENNVILVSVEIIDADFGISGIYTCPNKKKRKLNDNKKHKSNDKKHKK